MKRSVIFVFFVVLAITALLFSGKFLSHPRNTSANAGASGAPSYNLGPQRGTMAPDFKLDVLAGKGKTIQLSSLRGKAVVVNFWATYCVPCKKEMPALAALQKKYESQGLQILGIVVDDAGEQTTLDFMHKMGVNYPVLVHTDQVDDLYGGIDGLPTTFYLDRNGKVVDRVLGGAPEEEIEASIKKALGQDSTTAATK